MDTQLQHDIVEAHHNTPVTEHLGWWKTTELVMRNYWCPGMGHYTAKYVKGCNLCKLCNWTKTFPTAPAGKLMPNGIPYHWWQIILVDLITELPQSHSYDSILVTVDRLSKGAHFIPTMSNITSLGVTQLFQGKTSHTPTTTTSVRVSFSSLLFSLYCFCCIALVLIPSHIPKPPFNSLLAHLQGFTGRCFACSHPATAA